MNLSLEIWILVHRKMFEIFSLWNHLSGTLFNLSIERFSFARRKLIGFSSTTLNYSLRYLPLFHLRPRQTRTHCCGHIVADTNVSPFARARNICCGHQKCFWFSSETFCVCNKCFPVCAAQETSWATICPQQYVVVCQGLNQILNQSQSCLTRTHFPAFCVCYM